MRKHLLIIVAITISFVSCKTNSLQKRIVKKSEKDKIVIREFINNFYFNENYDYDKTIKHLNLYAKTPEAVDSNKRLLEWVHQGMRILVKHYKYSKKYKVFNYIEAKDDSIISRNKNFTKLSYKEKENVYYVVFNSVIDQGPFFIVDSHKIKSFFTDYTIIGNDSIYPYMLNEKPTLFVD
jgi:hypothetical protein